MRKLSRLSSAFLFFMSFILSNINGVEDRLFNSHADFSVDGNNSFPIKLLITHPHAYDGIPPSEVTYHPLDPLTSSEIQLAVYILKAVQNSNQWLFKTVTLKEPSKDQLLQPFLEDDDNSVAAAGKVYRRVLAIVQDLESHKSFEAVINLNRISVESWKPAKNGTKPPMITLEDVQSAQNILLANPDVVKRIKLTGYNLSQVACDSWEAGYVADNPNYADSKRLVQTFIFGMNSAGDNIYAHPFDFVVYVDLFSKTVRNIENLPIQNDFSLDNRKGNSVPKAEANYFGIKSTLNPIDISQANGPSFKLHGYGLSWQNFKMRIGYNAREGVFLHHVKYNDNGILRPLLYRMSLSEIFVSFGDPRPPNHRMKSFDMGKYRLGMSTSELPIKKFCPGEAFYLNMVYNNELGETFTKKNAICIVEEDSGLLWAHYDWTQGKTAVTRSQRLSINFLASVCYSDYWISWRFYEDATIELSIKLTGLKTTSLMAIDVKAPPYGNLMAPQLYTPINQYFFAARIDADIDGPINSVAIEDIVPVEGGIGSVTNPYGNGITTKETVLKTVTEAKTNLSPNTGRTWKVQNPGSIHSLTKRPVSWKLVPKGNYVPLLLTKDSPLRKNTVWTDYNVWVTPYHDDQVYVSGLWMNKDGLEEWVDANRTASIENTDLVMWHVFGIINVPVAENWPVSSDSQGLTGFILKPNSFFNKNPAIPAS